MTTRQVEKAFTQYGGKKHSANCGAEALWALKLSLERLNQEVAPAALFPSAPVVVMTTQN